VKGNIEYIDQLKQENERLSIIKDKGQKSVDDLTDEVSNHSSILQSEAEEMETKKKKLQN